MRGDKALIIRGLQARIDDITERGRREEREAREQGKPYDVQGEALKRCKIKRRIRARLKELGAR